MAFLDKQKIEQTYNISPLSEILSAETSVIADIVVKQTKHTLVSSDFDSILRNFMTLSPHNDLDVKKWFSISKIVNQIVNHNEFSNKIQSSDVFDLHDILVSVNYEPLIKRLKTKLSQRDKTIFSLQVTVKEQTKQMNVLREMTRNSTGLNSPSIRDKKKNSSKIDTISLRIPKSEISTFKIDQISKNNTVFQLENKELENHLVFSEETQKELEFLFGKVKNNFFALFFFNTFFLKGKHYQKNGVSYLNESQLEFFYSFFGANKIQVSKEEIPEWIYKSIENLNIEMEELPHLSTKQVFALKQLLSGELKVTLDQINLMKQHEINKKENPENEENVELDIADETILKLATLEEERLDFCFINIWNNQKLSFFESILIKYQNISNDLMESQELNVLLSFVLKCCNFVNQWNKFRSSSTSISLSSVKNLQFSLINNGSFKGNDFFYFLASQVYKSENRDSLLKVTKFLSEIDLILSLKLPDLDQISNAFDFFNSKLDLAKKIDLENKSWKSYAEISLNNCLSRLSSLKKLFKKVESTVVLLNHYLCCASFKEALESLNFLLLKLQDGFKKIDEVYHREEQISSKFLHNESVGVLDYHYSLEDEQDYERNDTSSIIEKQLKSGSFYGRQN